MKRLTTTHARFVNKTSPPPNMTALRTYTTGRHLGASQRQQTVKPTAQQRYRPQSPDRTAFAPLAGDAEFCAATALRTSCCELLPEIACGPS